MCSYIYIYTQYTHVFLGNQLEIEMDSTNSMRCMVMQTAKKIILGFGFVQKRKDLPCPIHGHLIIGKAGESIHGMDYGIMICCDMVAPI